MQFDQQKPNGLTLTCSLTCSLTSKSPWGYMHSNFQSPWAWSCFAISTKCWRAMFLQKCIVYKDLQNITFGNTELHWQQFNFFLHIFCRNPLGCKRSSITSSAWGWWLWPVWFWMAYVQLHRPNWKFQWNMHLQPVQKCHGNQLSLIPTTPRLRP